MAKKNDAKLRPCPLCGNPNPTDQGYGISCPRCGLWLGDGTSTVEFGGYKKLWNKREGLGAGISQALNEGDGTYRP